MSESTNSAHRSPLIRFLKVGDYDALELVYEEIINLGQSEASFIDTVLDGWCEEQAIANLLFCPSLIPKSRRFDILMKALSSEQAPYYVLAAVVGLQKIDPASWENEQRYSIKRRLIEIVTEDVDVVAARASVTVWEYLDDSNDSEFLNLYPVETATANRNIIAYALTRFSDADKKKFNFDLKAMNITWGTRRKFLKRFKRYLRGKRSGSAVFLQTPQYVDVPSLGDVDQHAFIDG